MVMRTLIMSMSTKKIWRMIIMMKRMKEVVIDFFNSYRIKWKLRRLRWR